MDSQQIDLLAERYGPSLVLYARQWCQHPDDALQDALMDLMRLNAAPNDPAAWLFTTVKRKAHNIARSEKRLTTRHVAASQTRDLWFEADTERPIVEAELQQSLESLPDIERQIIVARIWGELSFEQIGKLVSMSSSSAHRRYKHALAGLANRLGEGTNGKVTKR